ncbi:NAD/NADP octopine/nopaline dehydrogenase (plasmid) [Agrobacterium tumefaciens]|uniref:NAD/NADP octopine/nopaline dehydrogenase n=2 Tax=Agrobacterium tumefaciens TaxID=358 RepID=A0A2L2LMQ3_AGRTU|nr:NAD/NADP octopine/nopaline dehydrogenase [Agrobacterium tumefaciens]
MAAQGAIEGSFQPSIAVNVQVLADGAEVLVVALPANGHKAVLDAVAPHITPKHAVIFSSHTSFGALYLSSLLAMRGFSVPIVAWGTTIVTGRQTSPTSVQVNTVRKQIDIATIPASRWQSGLSLCQALFGDRFLDRGSLMAIALSNLNPQNHMGIALGNMTRMEREEAWIQSQNVTPNVGRLLEQLDQERVAIAERLGLDVRTIFEHFHLSYHVPMGSISEMNQEIYRAGRAGNGPMTAASRYVTEDVPFGLVVTAKIGRLVGCPAILHEAGIQIFSAMYGRNFEAENDLLAALDLERMDLGDLQDLCRDGFAAAA